MWGEAVWPCQMGNPCAKKPPVRNVTGRRSCCLQLYTSSSVQHSIVGHHAAFTGVCFEACLNF